MKNEKQVMPGLGGELLSGSLTDAAIQQATGKNPHFAILPWVNVVKIGGQSIMDRGRSAVYPLWTRSSPTWRRHKMILGTGAGTRARHVYSLAIDLGLAGRRAHCARHGGRLAERADAALPAGAVRHPVPRAGRLRTAAALPDGARRGDLPGHAALQAVGAESRRSDAFRRSAPIPAAS